MSNWRSKSQVNRKFQPHTPPSGVVVSTAEEGLHGRKRSVYFTSTTQIAHKSPIQVSLVTSLFSKVSLGRVSLHLKQDGDYYTEAQCEAMVMCGNNHWIITPNLTRSI